MPLHRQRPHAGLGVRQARLHLERLACRIEGLGLAALGVEDQRERQPRVAPFAVREPDRLARGPLRLGQPAHLPERFAQPRRRRVGGRVFLKRVFPEGERIGPHLLPLNAGHPEEHDGRHAEDRRLLAEPRAGGEPGAVEQPAEAEGHARHRQIEIAVGRGAIDRHDVRHRQERQHDDRAGESDPAVGPNGEDGRGNEAREDHEGHRQRQVPHGGEPVVGAEVHGERYELRVEGQDPWLDRHRGPERAARILRLGLEDGRLRGLEEEPCREKRDRRELSAAHGERPEPPRLSPPKEPPVGPEDHGRRDSRFFARHGQKAEPGAANRPPAVAIRGRRIVPYREQERPERARGHEQVFPKRRLAHGLRHDGVHRKHQRRQPGVGRAFSLSLPCPAQPPRNPPRHHHIHRMQQHAREVIAKRILPPDRRIEHERCELHGAVEVEHVHREHLAREHGQPVPRIVDEVASQDLQPRVVDEPRRERGPKHGQRDRREGECLLAWRECGSHGNTAEYHSAATRW